jgi:hypothetical protein
VFPVLGAQGLTRGARLRVRLGEVDEIALDVSGTVIERLDDPVVERRRHVDRTRTNPRPARSRLRGRERARGQHRAIIPPS